MKINVTEKGSLKIYNGLVSGFSSSNYLEVTPSFNVSSAQNWEVVYKIITSDKITTGQSVCGHTGSSTADPIAITTNTSKHFALTVSSSTSSTFINAVSGTYTMLPNTAYWLKVTFDGSKYVLSYSLDGINFTEDVVKESTKVPYTSNLVLGRQQGDSSEFPFLGTIDLKDCYIKIDGEIWWTGTVEGTQCVRAYGLKCRQTKYYKEIVTEEGDTYECFTWQSSDTPLYSYVKVPYDVGDSLFIHEDMVHDLVTDVSQLVEDITSIKSINEDGTITFGSGNTTLYRYPEGDVTSSIIELEPSTPDDYDVVKIVDSFHSLQTRGEVKYACYKKTDGSYTYYSYIAYPFTSNVKLYTHKDGHQIQALYENELSSRLLTNFESVTEEELVIAGKTFNRYYVGDLKKMNDIYVYWRRKK